MERPPSPDPVSEAAAYQEHLLGLLGGDDPAVVQAATPAAWRGPTAEAGARAARGAGAGGEGRRGGDDPAVVQAATPAAWRALTAEAGARVAERPEPEEWSVLECLGHATDSEIVYAGRYRWSVAHDEPPLIGSHQDLWVERLHHGQDDPAELLALFEALRVANLAMWSRSTQRERARVGMHAGRGPERFHRAQARRTLDALAG